VCGGVLGESIYEMLLCDCSRPGLKSHGRRSLDSGFTLACAEWDYPARGAQRRPTHTHPKGFTANRAAISRTPANSLSYLSVC